MSKFYYGKKMLIFCSRFQNECFKCSKLYKYFTLHFSMSNISPNKRCYVLFSKSVTHRKIPNIWNMLRFPRIVPRRQLPWWRRGAGGRMRYFQPILWSRIPHGWASGQWAMLRHAQLAQRVSQVNWGQVKIEEYYWILRYLVAVIGYEKPRTLIL